jgi:hypothetical protein
MCRLYNTPAKRIPFQKTAVVGRVVGRETIVVASQVHVALGGQVVRHLA